MMVKKQGRLVQMKGRFPILTLTFLNMLDFIMKGRNFFLFLVLSCWGSLNAVSLDVVFRFDDYRLVEDSLRNELIETFSRHQIPISLAIVPYQEGRMLCTDTAGIRQLDALASEGLVEIAMHGYSHQKCSDYGEFGGVDPELQRQWLTASYQVLDSLFSMPPITFIPPWNNYDTTTLDVLAELGVKVVSSCMTIGQSFDNPQLTYLPCTVGTSDAFPSFSEALSNNANRNGILVFMFHPYDFDESFTMDDLDALLTEVSTMRNVRCVTFRDLWSEGVVSDRCRMEANLEVNLLTKLMGVNTIIQPTLLAVVRRMANLLIYWLTTALMMFASLRLIRRIRTLKSPAWIHMLVLLCFFALLFGCVWLHAWSPLKSLLLSIVLPLVYGALVFSFFSKRTE